MTLISKLTSLRVQTGLTQADVAEKLNVSRQAVSRWEAGDSFPSTENLVLLSQLYGVTLDYLVNGDAPEPGPAVAVMEAPGQVSPEEPHWRKPTLAGVVIGLAIAAVLALLALSFSIGYEKGVTDTTPTYPVYEDVLDEADFDGSFDLVGW